MTTTSAESAVTTFQQWLVGTTDAKHLNDVYGIDAEMAQVPSPEDVTEIVRAFGRWHYYVSGCSEQPRDVRDDLIKSFESLMRCYGVSVKQIEVRNA